MAKVTDAVRAMKTMRRASLVVLILAIAPAGCADEILDISRDATADRAGDATRASADDAGDSAAERDAGASDEPSVDDVASDAPEDAGGRR